MKTILTIILTALICGGAFIALSRGSGFGRPPEPTSVRVEPARRGELVETVSAPGTIRARSKVSISARVSARIEDLPHPAGSTVRVRDVLVKLDSTDLEAQLRAAQARYSAQQQQITVAEVRLKSQESTIASVDIQLQDARRELSRQRQLLENRDVSQQAVDQAQARVDQLQAQKLSQEQQLEADRANLVVLKHQLEAADADIARARDNLSYTTIRSPIDGVVTRVNAERGELVVTGTMNNAGTVILEVADLSAMIVEARVDESVIASVREKQRANVRMQAYPGRVFKGSVLTVALAETEVARDGSKHYKCEILMDATNERIFSGLTADVDIETARHPSVLRVPSQAVLGRAVDDLPPSMRDLPEVDRTRTFATVVYRIVDGKAVVTPVRVGPSDLTHTAIESGLKAGDLVVVGPYKVLEAIGHDQAIRSEADAAAASIGAAPATSPAP
ncbi:MAG TPA: efflux RND transporter periplasmic adaptor subunit [Tepidisphaeraceae bacterium]|nr:efflux RND transporter periplasmic adaptor subunit [Tepidisphaeraceae bacterium]